MKKRYPSTIMGTALTPWDENFDIDEKSFRKQVRRMTDSGIYSIYTFGTAGEGFAVSDSQFMHMAEIFVDEMSAPGMLPMMGIMSLSMPTILWRIEKCRQIGINDFQISFPSWGALTDASVMIFFKEILERFPDCNFLHYNNPASKKKLGLEHYIKLAEMYPNLAAVKMPGLKPEETELIDYVVTDKMPMQIFVGEPMFSNLSAKGECGLLLTALSINYKISWDFFNAGKAKDMDEVRRIFKGYEKIRDAMRDTMPGDRMGGAYDKLFFKLQMPDFPQRMLPPYESISDDDFKNFKTAVVDVVPEWYNNLK